MEQVDAGHHLEQFAGDVSPSPTAGRRHVELARICLREGDKFGNRPGGQRRVHQHDVRLAHEARDRCDVGACQWKLDERRRYLRDFNEATEPQQQHTYPNHGHAWNYRPPISESEAGTKSPSLFAIETDGLKENLNDPKNYEDSSQTHDNVRRVYLLHFQSS